jgi:hypothetical protein
MKRTYRQWVVEGARGYFLTASVAVNAARLINPLDRSGGYFVRRDTASPDQHVLRERLPDHERQEVTGAEGRRREQVGWILTTQVERPAEVVKRGWLMWDTVGEVIERLIGEPDRCESERSAQ